MSRVTRVADLLVTVRDYLLYTVHQLVSQEGLVIMNHKSGNWGGHTNGHIVTYSDTHRHIVSDTHGHTVSDTHGHTVTHCDT